MGALTNNSNAEKLLEQHCSETAWKRLFRRIFVPVLSWDWRVFVPALPWGSRMSPVPNQQQQKSYKPKCVCQWPWPPQAEQHSRASWEASAMPVSQGYTHCTGSDRHRFCVTKWRTSLPTLLQWNDTPLRLGTSSVASTVGLETAGRDRTTHSKTHRMRYKMCALVDRREGMRAEGSPAYTSSWSSGKTVERPISCTRCVALWTRELAGRPTPCLGAPMKAYSTEKPPQPWSQVDQYSCSPV
jgi:hypothetical protein